MFSVNIFFLNQETTELQYTSEWDFGGGGRGGCTVGISTPRTTGKSSWNGYNYMEFENKI